jgi:type VI protein secretion system component Hcp
MKKALLFLSFLAAVPSLSASQLMLMSISIGGVSCSEPARISGVGPGVSIEDWSWGSSIPTSTDWGNFGVPVGYPSAMTLTIKKPLDACTSQLLKARTQAPSVELTIQQFALDANGQLVVALRATFSSGLVSTYLVDGVAGGSPSETWGVTVGYACFEEPLAGTPSVCLRF